MADEEVLYLALLKKDKLVESIYHVVYEDSIASYAFQLSKFMDRGFVVGKQGIGRVYSRPEFGDLDSDLYYYAFLKKNFTIVDEEEGNDV